jgi:hypothetical protein
MSEQGKKDARHGGRVKDNTATQRVAIDSKECLHVVLEGPELDVAGVCTKCGRLIAT